jgi:hypothetical protein
MGQLLKLNSPSTLSSDLHHVKQHAADSRHVGATEGTPCRWRIREIIPADFHNERQFQFFFNRRPARATSSARHAKD